MTASPKLILLVDDDYDCLTIAQHALEAAGFRVAACYGPDEAFEQIVKEKPDAIVTDLMMSSLDSGFAFSKRVRADARFATIPILVMTAVGKQMGFDFRPRSRADLAAMGVDGFLDKPVRPAALVDAIRAVLEHA